MTELTKTDKTRIDLWTARDMNFVIAPGSGKGVGVIPKYTPCTKPVYTKKMKAYIEQMEQTDGERSVCVDLEGMLRYVHRADVLTKEEYDAVRAKEHSSLRALCSKPRGALGEVDTNADGSQAPMATSLQERGEGSPDD